MGKVALSIKWKVALVIIGLALIGSLILVGGGSSEKGEYATVERGSIIQEVSVTGRVKAVERAELGLEKGGRVAWISARVGGAVSAGQSLLAIDNGDLLASLEQAQANVKKEEANLTELLRGTRPEEIRIQESKVASAEISVEDSVKNLVDTLIDTYTKSDDAIRNKIDQFFSSPRTQSAQLNFTIADTQLESDLENGRYILETVLVDWEKKARSVSVNDDLTQMLSLTKRNMESVRLFLEKVSQAVNGLNANTTLTQTTIDTYKSSVSTARTNVNTATSNLSAAEEKFRTAESALATAEKELALKKAGSTPEAITAQEAALQYAVAEIKNIEAQIAKTVIRAPFAGTVVKQEAKVGEILPANSAVITLISEGNFNIEANVPEADIAKVSVGDEAVVTLDAYGSDVEFSARIALIEPGETIVDGVPTYKVTFEFTTQDPRIKSGMTANIDISILSKASVMRIPQRFVLGKNGTRTVTVLRNGALETVNVTLGERGEGGFVEVVEGLVLGEKIFVADEK